MSYVFEQLPLAVSPRDDATFDNFYAQGNEQLVTALRSVGLPDGERSLFLYGTVGCGRSHLLQATCHSVDARNGHSVYLPLADLVDFNPADLFAGLEQVDLVCLDDIHKVVESAVWAEQLFHLYNRLKAADTALVVSADGPPRRLTVVLADLVSRLSWGSVYRVETGDESYWMALLQSRARGRGLIMGDDVAQFIVHRHQRDGHGLMQVLDTLDRVSLSAQRRLSIPFVKQVMGW